MRNERKTRKTQESFGRKDSQMSAGSRIEVNSSAICQCTDGNRLKLDGSVTNLCIEFYVRKLGPEVFNSSGDVEPVRSPS